MLSKQYRLSKKEFNKAFKQKGQFFKESFLRIKIIKNDLDLSRFGISCGIRISKKATKRNFVKRRISEVLRINLKKISSGYDIIVIPEPIILDQSYQAIDKLLIYLFKQAGILKKNI